MNEANSNDSLKSANDDIRHRINGQRLSFSPIIPLPSLDRNKDHDDDENNAYYEDPTAADVEENISVLSRSLLPPSTPEDTTKKHNRDCPSQGIRANDAIAENNDGGYFQQLRGGIAKRAC